MTPQLVSRIAVVIVALAIAALVAAFVPVDGNGTAGRLPAASASTR